MEVIRVREEILGEFIEKLDKTRKYLDYLYVHNNNIKNAFMEIREKCKDMKFICDDYYYIRLAREIEVHDLSKLSKEEFIQYREAFFPTVFETNKPEFEEKKRCIYSFEHHKKNNQHHWENWTQKDYHDPNEWMVHCAHMVIDWMAMAYQIGDTAKKFYEKNKEKIKLPKYAINFIYEIFDRVYIE